MLTFFRGKDYPQWLHRGGYLRGAEAPLLMNNTPRAGSPWPSCGLAAGRPLHEYFHPNHGQTTPEAFVRIPRRANPALTPHNISGVPGDRFSALPAGPVSGATELVRGTPGWLFGTFPECARPAGSLTSSLSLSRRVLGCIVTIPPRC